jgi:AcrR family transcriptional regulator
VARISAAAIQADAQADTPSGPRDRRGRLLQTGIEIFSRNGFEDVGVSEIAERAGVAHGLLFHYFGSKVGFYGAVLEARSAQIQAMFAANTAPDPARWLRKELDLVLDGVIKHPAYFTTLIHGALGAERHVQQTVRHQREAGAARLIAKLGVDDPSPLLEMAIIGWVASVNEVVVQWAEAGRPVAKSRIRPILIGTLNGTLRAVAEQAPGDAFDPELFAKA